MEIEMLLGQVDYLKDISVKSRQAVAKICVLKTLPKKSYIFQEGDTGHSVYICLKGHIQLHKNTPDGREIVIKIIRSGEIFAEVILFEESRYPVTATTLTTCKVLVLPKAGFHELLNLEDFRNDFILMLMRKQRYLAEQIKYLTNYDVEDRLFHFLTSNYGPQERIRLSLSKKDIAAAIGATPETLSRLLFRLKNEGKLTWEGKEITIAQSRWISKTND
jgi:CRP/FNR family transcriptional regulator